MLARYRAAVAASSTGWDDRYEALDEILHNEPSLYLGGGPLGPAKIDLGKQKIRVPDKGEARRVAPKEPPAVKKVRAALVKAGTKDIAICVRGGKLTLSGIALEAIGKLEKALSALKG